jgi:hypothetical protein
MQCMIRLSLALKSYKIYFSYIKFARSWQAERIICPRNMYLQACDTAGNDCQFPAGLTNDS